MNTPAYSIVFQSDIYDSLTLVNQAHIKIFRQFKGTRFKDVWCPVPVKNYKAQKPGDFPRLIGGVPIFSERALEILNPLIFQSIEVFHIECIDCINKDFYAINVIEILDCLDYCNSEIKRLSSGIISNIKRPVLKKGCFEGKHIFKIPETSISMVFVSAKFKSLVEENNLLGIRFEEIDSV